jgi:hypothetical protein
MIKTLTKGALKSYNWAFSQYRMAVAAFTEACKEV